MVVGFKAEIEAEGLLVVEGSAVEVSADEEALDSGVRPEGKAFGFGWNPFDEGAVEVDLKSVEKVEVFAFPTASEDRADAGVVDLASEAELLEGKVFDFLGLPAECGIDFEVAESGGFGDEEAEVFTFKMVVES